MGPIDQCFGVALLGRVLGEAVATSSAEYAVWSIYLGWVRLPGALAASACLQAGLASRLGERSRGDAAGAATGLKPERRRSRRYLTAIPLRAPDGFEQISRLTWVVDVDARPTGYDIALGVDPEDKAA